MKKLLYTISVITIAAVLLTACEKEEDVNTTQVVGTWELQNVRYVGYDTTFNPVKVNTIEDTFSKYDTRVLQINPDYTFSMVYFPVKNGSTGKYRMENDYIIFLDSNVRSDFRYLFPLDSSQVTDYNTLMLISSGVTAQGNYTETFTYSRQ